MPKPLLGLLQEIAHIAGAGLDYEGGLVKFSRLDLAELFSSPGPRWAGLAPRAYRPRLTSRSRVLPHQGAAEKARRLAFARRHHA